MPIASAQPLSHPITLSTTSAQTEIEAGSVASFVVKVSNNELLPRDISLAGVDTPIGWFYDFAPQNMSLPGNSSNSTTLTITAPADPIANVTLSFQATETLPTGAQQVDSNLLSFTFNVVAPPPPAPAPAAPRVTMSAASASGAPGDAVSALLTLTSDTDMALTLKILGPTTWSAGFELTTINLHPGLTATRTVHATVPQGTPPGVTTFTIQALSDTHAYATSWNVTSVAPPASSTSPTPPTSSGSTSGSTTSGGTAPSTATGSSGSGSTTADEPTFALIATPEPAQIDAPAGEAVAGLKVRLQNTGSAPLHLRLIPRAGDGWPVRLSATEFDLGAGTIRDINLEMDVPSDVVPGGRATADVAILGDAGLLKHATFTLITVAGKPHQETTTAALVAPNEPAGGLGLSPVTTTVVVGLGAVGVGALALARRPLREKLIWGGVGLYTRLLRPDVLGHEERDRLYKLVETQPGIHFHALQRELNWNTGTLTYHLRVLEKHGFVVDRRDGPLRRFYISGAAPRKELFNQDQPHGLRADVLEAIRNRGGISQSDLALALGANKQTVNYHVKALERAGTIRVEKRGRETFLYVGTGAPAGAPATDEARA